MFARYSLLNLRTILGSLVMCVALLAGCTSLTAPPTKEELISQFTGCRTNPNWSPPQRVRRNITPQQIARINRGTYKDYGASLFGVSYIIEELPEAQEYLNVVADRLLASLGAGAPGNIVILLESSKNTAQAYPKYNVILVSDILLEELQSEEEVAALLAHELAHLLLRDDNRVNWISGQRMLTGLLGKAGDVYGALVSLEEDESTGDVRINQQILDDMTKLNNSLGATADVLAKNMISNTWSRNQERDADEMAVALMACAGYDPASGMDQLLNTLQDWEDDYQPFLKRTSNRFQDINTQLKDAAEASGNVGLLDFGLEHIHLLIKIITEQLGGDSHDNINTRRQVVKAYLTKHHADQAWQRRNTKDYVSSLQGINTTTVLENYNWAWSARDYLLDQRYERAELASFKAIRGRNSTAILSRVVFSLVRFSQGDEPNAVRNLDKIDQSNFSPIRDGERLAMVYAARGQDENAIRVLSHLTTLYGDQIYPIKIAVAKKQGLTQRLQRLLKACKKASPAIGNGSGLKKKCEKAAGVKSSSFIPLLDSGNSQQQSSTSNPRATESAAATRPAATSNATAGNDASSEENTVGNIIDEGIGTLRGLIE